MSVYLATFLAVGYAASAVRLPFQQWVALISVTLATAFTVRILERGRWRLGFFVPPRLALIDLLRGGAFAGLLIMIVDGLLLLSSNLRHTRGSGLPWLELGTVFIPAAFHEELAFRGYLFQKMRCWNRAAAIAITALVFAALHGGNQGISLVAIVNLVLAGVLLALAYERYQRLWFPIGIHLVWNILSGPIFGYGVSGYIAKATLFRTLGSGAAWITGGAFGIEGSVCMGLVELGGIVLLMKMRSSNANAEFRSAREGF